MATKKKKKLAANSNKSAPKRASASSCLLPTLQPDVTLLSRWDLTALLAPDPAPPPPPLQDFLVDPRDGVWRNRRS